MFGYVKPRAADLYVREYDFYRAAYCGVCRAMRKNTGFFSSFSLSYDIVFLALCRMLVTDRQVGSCRRRCPAHPFRKRPCLENNEALLYAARCSALLTLEKLEDDRADGGFGKKARAFLLLPIFRRAAKKAALPDLTCATRASLARLAAMEKERVASVDRPADEFGQYLGAVFRDGIADETVAALFGEVGYQLGKFIYAADAADDHAEDKKRGDYNPFVLLYPDADFSSALPDAVRTGLRLNLADLAAAVEKLPFADGTAVEHILKNTVYLGLSDVVETLGKPKTKKERKSSPHD